MSAKYSIGQTIIVNTSDYKDEDVLEGDEATITRVLLDKTFDPIYIIEFKDGFELEINESEIKLKIDSLCIESSIH